MLEIIIVRHGETDWNKEEIFRGLIDIDINNRGIEQAKAIGRVLSQKKVNTIYSSPLKRAYNTAQYIANYHSLEVSIEPSFIDINYGIWSGKSHEEVRQRDKGLYQKWIKDPHLVRIPQGESLEEVRIRAVKGLTQIIEKTLKEGCIIIVSHRVVNKVLICALLGMDNSCFWKIKQDPGAYTIFDYEDNNFILTLHNQTSHLSQMVDYKDF